MNNFNWAADDAHDHVAQTNQKQEPPPARATPSAAANPVTAAHPHRGRRQQGELLELGQFGQRVGSGPIRCCAPRDTHRRRLRERHLLLDPAGRVSQRWATADQPQPQRRPSPRHLLVNTAWNGADKVTKGLDPSAAVWAAVEAAHRKRHRVEARTALPRAPTASHPCNFAIDGRAAPTRSARSKPARHSTLDLQWYQQLASLRLELENENAEGLARLRHHDQHRGGRRPHRADGTGTYQVQVIGGAPTAYLLSGKLTAQGAPAGLPRPNDSFEHATPVQLVAPRQVAAAFRSTG